MVWLLRAVLGGGAGVIAVVSALSLTGSDPVATSVTTVQAQNGAVLSTVAATGNIAPVASASVDLPSGSTIASIQVSAGDTVSAGQVLATSDSAEETRQLAVAREQLRHAKAQLALGRAGPSALDISRDVAAEGQARVAVTNAVRALSRARAISGSSNRGSAVALTGAQQQLASSKRRLAAERKALSTARQIAATRARASRAAAGTTAARATDVRSVQQEQVNMQKQQMSNAATVSNLQRQIGDAQSARDAELAQRLRSQLATVEAASVDLDKRLLDLSFQLTLANGRLQEQQSAEAGARAAQSSAEAEADRLVASVASAAELVESHGRSIAAVRSTAGQTRTGGTLTVKEAEAALATSRAALRATLATNAAARAVDPATVVAGRLAVVQASAQVAAARRALAATVLRAPVSGVVAAVNGVVGETAGASTSSAVLPGAQGQSGGGLIALTQTKGLVVVVGVNETDAATVKVGQPAIASVDALGPQAFAAHVASVAPTSTLVSNVVTYVVTLALDNPQGRLKPGMTAAIEIVVARRLGVVNVPTSALQAGAGGTFVTIQTGDGEQVPSTVTTGLQGDTTIEITSGLEAGQLVVLPSLKLGLTKTTKSKSGALLSGGK